MAIEYLTVSLTRKEVQRIFSKITIDPAIEWRQTPCWSYGSSITRKGYGMLTWRRKGMAIHRLMYAWAVAPIPKGQEHGEIDHLCRNRACCNPIHLEFVSSWTNMIRGEGVCAVNARKTHCKRGHEFTPENTYRVKDGKGCKACKPIQDRLYYVASRRPGIRTKKSKYAHIT